MNETNIIFSSSTNTTMKESSIPNHNIICFDTIFSIANLSIIDKYEIKLPQEIYHKEITYSFKDKIESLDSLVNSNEEIRIWSSHLEINSYLLFLYLCNYLKNSNCNLFVVFSDEYSKDCYSPSCMTKKELEKSVNIEHQLSKKEIENYAENWLEIINDPKDMRILENGLVKTITYDYYNEAIIEKLKVVGEIKISEFVGMLMAEYHLSDTLIVHFIEILISQNKIKIVKQSEKCAFENRIMIAK